jgi:hypothetical protein
MLQAKFTKKSTSLDEISLPVSQIPDKITDGFDQLLPKNLFKRAVLKNVKVKGSTIEAILKVLFVMPFVDVSSVRALYLSGYHALAVMGKDAIYGLKNNTWMNWRALLDMTFDNFNKIIKEKSTSSPGDIRAFIVDDTTTGKTGKTIELIGRVFDHVNHMYLLGFKMQCLGLWDSKNFLGIDFSVHSEKGKNSNRPQGMRKKDIKKRFQKKRPNESPGYERAMETFKSKIEVAVSMIERAVKRGIVASYVLADSWYINETFIQGIRAIKKIKLHVIVMMPAVRIFEIEGKEMKSDVIIAKLRKSKKTSRKFRMQYFYVIAEYKGILMKIFFVKIGYGDYNENWKILISTDTQLSFHQVIKIYQIRWSIEVFFKETKQYLRVGKCQSQDFDAQIASITICFIQHMLLALYKRFEDYETIGGIFRNSKENMAKLTLVDRIWEIFLGLVKKINTTQKPEIELILLNIFNEDIKNEIIAELFCFENKKRLIAA